MKKFIAVIMVLIGIQAQADEAPALDSQIINDTSHSHLSSCPQYRPGNWNVFANVLVWFASEEPSSIWASVISSKPVDTTTFEGKNISFDWHYGVRAGIGYNFYYDNWDTELYWTWYRTEARSSVPNNDHTILSEFFASFVNQDIGKSAQINWTLLYNMFDWELGRCFSVSDTLFLRPFIGIKGGWIHQKIRSNYENIVLLTSRTFTSKEDLKNNFWGVGPSIGANTKWKLVDYRRSFFSFIGDFSTSMLWGTWICKDEYSNSTPKEISVEMKNSTLGALMLRGFIGVGWDVDFKGGNHFSAKFGYESQFWLNQLRIPTFQQLRLHGDLTLQGGTFEFRLDF